MTTSDKSNNQPNFSGVYSNFTRWHIDEINKKSTMSKPKDYMEFPIDWDKSRPIVEHLYYIFEQYIQDVKDYCTYLEKNKDAEENSVTKEAAKAININEIKKICHNILSLTNKSVNGEFIDSKELLWLYEILQTSICIISRKNIEKQETDEPFVFYRMRGDVNLFEESEFYHVPFDKIYLSSSERFSAAGYPCLYIGYSKECCAKELGQKSGSIIKMTLKNDAELIILDFADYTNQLSNSNSQFNMFLWWPILAACYVTPSKDAPNGRFKEEYLFPQLITKYVLLLKSSSMINFSQLNGIRYFSCREPRLNTTQPTYLNLVLFPDLKSNSTDLSIVNDSHLEKPYDFQREPYDYDLLKKFDFDTPSNI